MPRPQLPFVTTTAAEEIDATKLLGVYSDVMKSMQLQVERLNIDELGFQVKLPPELEVHECARTKPVEEFLSCARTLPLKCVRKEKPIFGELPIRPHRKKHESVVTHSPLLSELFCDQNILMDHPSNNVETIETIVTFPENCEMGSDTHYDNIESITNDMSELVDVGVYRQLEKEEERSKLENEQLVSFKRSDLPQFSKCALHVKTEGIFSSRGVQVDEGLFIDKEVIDSYLQVKMSATLSDLKQQFLATEKKIAEVLRDKAILEEVVKQKILSIKDLTVNNPSKPAMKDQGSMTDSDPVNLFLMQDLTVNIPSKPVMKDQGSMTDSDPVNLACTTSPVSTQKKWENGDRKKTIGTLTPFDDEKYLVDTPTLSLAPYVGQTSQPPLQVSSEPDTESMNEDIKIGWMFSNPKPCARCYALRPQVRLLRALKKNMIRKGVWKADISHMLKDGVIPDKVIWDALGFHLQTVFVRLAMLCQLLEVVPLDSLLKVKAVSLSKMLKHLMSHLPLPSNVPQKYAALTTSSASTMGVYLFGYKLKELTQLLRVLRSRRHAVVFPYYFRAEIAVLERVAHGILECALRDMRRKCIEDNSLSSGSEDEFNCINYDQCDADDDSFLDMNSGTDDLDVILPMQTPKKPHTKKFEAKKHKEMLFGRKVSKSRTNPNHLSRSNLRCSKSPLHQVERLKGNFRSQSSGVTPLGTSDVAVETGGNRLRSCPAAVLNNISQYIAPESGWEAQAVYGPHRQDNVLVSSDVPQSTLLTVRTDSFSQNLDSLSPLPVHSVPSSPLKATSRSESTADCDYQNKSMLFTSQSVEPSLVLSNTTGSIVSPFVATLLSNTTGSIVSPFVATSSATGSVLDVNLRSASSVASGNYTLANLLEKAASSITHSLPLSKMPVSRQPSQVSTKCSTFSECSYSKAVADSTLTEFRGSTVKNPPVEVPSLAIALSATSSIPSGVFVGNQAPVSNWVKKFTQYVTTPNCSTFSKLLTRVNYSDSSLQSLPTPNCSTLSKLLTLVNYSESSLRPLRPKPAPRTSTPLSYKDSIASIGSKLPQCTTAVSMPDWSSSMNSKVTSGSATAIPSLHPSLLVTSTSTSLCCSSSSTSPAIFGSSMNSIPSTSNEIELSTTPSLNKDQRSNIGKPTILSANKLKNKIVVKWTFPGELHPYVAKYMVYFSGRESTHKKWYKFGRVEPSLLPMTLTLTFTGFIVDCVISVKAIYTSGLCSDLSDVVLV